LYENQEVAQGGAHRSRELPLLVPGAPATHWRLRERKRMEIHGLDHRSGRMGPRMECRLSGGRCPPYRKPQL